MTFDFAPDWMTSLMTAPSYSPADPPGTAGAGGMPSPTYPDNAQLAALVSELFAEGTLTAEQLSSMVGLPELKAHQPGALAALPAARKA